MGVELADHLRPAFYSREGVNLLTHGGLFFHLFIDEPLEAAQGFKVVFLEGDLDQFLDQGGDFLFVLQGSFYMAKPLKALADTVASRGLDWSGLDPLVESLRIDDERLETLKSVDFEELDGVYRSARARKFLSGIRKELGK